MFRNLPLLTFALIFVAGIALVGIAFVQPLGFSEAKIMFWSANATQSDFQIVLDSNLAGYFVEKDIDKTARYH